MRALALWLRARIAHRYLLDSRAEHLAQYPQMACLAFDAIGATINVNGRADKEELDFLLTRLSRHIAGRTVCDVGANIGNHSLAFAQSAARVIALEPHPVAFELLRLNCRNAPNVEPLRIGASDRSGTVTLAGPATNLGGSRITDRPAAGHAAHAVEVMPLDQLEALADANLGLLKIDVEGHEEQVLLGAAALLRDRQPIVLIEQHPDVIAGGTSPSLELLRSHGYRHFHSLEAHPRWRSPQWLPVPVRRLVRAIEAVLLGPPVRVAEAVRVERLEQRSYPLLIASAEPLDLGEV